MITQTRPLNCDDIRGIIRQYPTVFAALGTLGANSKEDAAWAVSKLILANPALVDSVVAAGMGLEIRQASNLGIFKWLAAADILAKTAAADIPLLPVLYEEIAPLCIPGGALQ